MDGHLIGSVPVVRWYILDNDRTVSFHTAFEQWPPESGKNEAVVFFSDKDTWPSIAALNLGISYSFMRNSTLREVEQFLASRNDIVVKKIVEV